MAANGAAIGARTEKLRGSEIYVGVTGYFSFLFSLEAESLVAAVMREKTKLGSFNRAGPVEPTVGSSPVQPVRSFRSILGPFSSKLVSKFSFR